LHIHTIFSVSESLGSCVLLGPAAFALKASIPLSGIPPGYRAVLLHSRNSPRTKVVLCDCNTLLRIRNASLFVPPSGSTG